jgi:hypothetical protein
MRRALSIPVILLLALVAGGSAAQALDAAKAQEITKASEQFAALAKDSHVTGKPPRQDDRAAKPLMDRVFDVSEVQRSSSSFKMADLGNLNAWNFAVVKIGLVYILSGTGVDDLAKLNATDEVVKRIDQNAADFAPEMGRYFDAQVWIQIGIMDILNDYLPTAPKARLEQQKFKEGLAQVRSGTTQTLNGFVTALPNTGLSDAWRRERMAVLAAAGPRAAKFLLPEQAAELREATINVAADMKDPAVKAGLTAFADTLKAK